MKLVIIFPLKITVNKDINPFNVKIKIYINNVLKNFLLNKSFIPIRKAIIGFFVLKNTP